MWAVISFGAHSGHVLTAPGDVAVAIRLTRMLARETDEPEVAGLLALMLLHQARREARIDRPVRWSRSTSRTGRCGTASGVVPCWSTRHQ
jgi:hypothetical protein